MKTEFLEADMPDKETIERAREDEREGKAPSTQAGEFVREEIEHIREGKHGARSTKQAIAIGLSKARRVNRMPGHIFFRLGCIMHKPAAVQAFRIRF